MKIRPGRIVATMVAAVLLGASVPAAAATFAVASGDVAAFVLNASPGTPTVQRWTPFTFPNGTNLNGAALNPSGTWTVDAGTWTVNTNRAAVTSTANARIRTTAPSPNAAVETVLTFPVTTRRAGVLLNGSGANYLAVEWRNVPGPAGQIRLRRFAPTASTLASVSVGLPASATLRVESYSATINVYIDGTLVLSHTLSAANQTIFKAAGATRFGLYASSDANTRFDDFHVDTP